MKKVELIDEHARQFVSEFGPATVYDQLLISHKQLNKEKWASNGADYLVTDSPAFLSLTYAHIGINWKDLKQVHFLKELYELLITNFNSYDYLFHFSPMRNNETSDDGKRIHKNYNEFLNIDESIMAFFKIYNVDFIKLNGDLDARVKKSLNIILSE